MPIYNSQPVKAVYSTKAYKVGKFTEWAVIAAVLARVVCETRMLCAEAGWGSIGFSVSIIRMPRRAHPYFVGFKESKHGWGS